MTVPRQLHHYSFKDYLMVEEMNPVRHEFLNGEIYAMVGGTMLHAALSGERTATGDWSVAATDAGSIARIEPIRCALDVDALYVRAGA